MNPSLQWPLYSKVAHVQRVKMLYKKALRNVRSENNHIQWYRHDAAILRERFKKNACVTDKREARELLRQGEEELFRKHHYAVVRHPESFLGVAFQRHVIPPDWLLDYWHPLEKAQYPDYFARRMKRKEEFMIRWEEEYMGKKYCREELPPDPDAPCNITIEADVECECECPPEEQGPEKC